jgi:hypothetical protein
MVGAPAAGAERASVAGPRARNNASESRALLILIETVSQNVQRLWTALVLFVNEVVVP